MKATYFPPLDTVTMASYWETTAIHSEAMYNGDGSWGFGYADWVNSPYGADVPLVRVVARHALGLLNLIEMGHTDSVTVQRTKLALNWLFTRQTKEGAWPLYNVNRVTVSIQSIYPTALAARALSRGYKVLRNPRHMIVARQAMEWQKARPDDDSPYMRGMVVSAILDLYQAIYDTTLIGDAVDQAMLIVSRQYPNGSWVIQTPVTSREHANILESLLLLNEVLVDEHPFKRRLHAAIVAGLNFLFEHQLDDGNFTDALSGKVSRNAPTIEIIALIKARESLGKSEFDMAITGAIRALNAHPSNNRMLYRGSQDMRFLAMTEALRWFLSTQMINSTSAMNLENRPN